MEQVVILHNFQRSLHMPPFFMYARFCISPHFFDSDPPPPPLLLFMAVMRLMRTLRIVSGMSYAEPNRIAGAKRDGCCSRLNRNRCYTRPNRNRFVCVCVCVCVCACVCVFIKLHMTAQSGLVILVILCHSRCPPKGGLCVCVCVCIY